MRDAIHSEMQELGIKNTENIKNKEKEIIINAETVREYFRKFWETDNSLESLKKELRKNEKERTEKLVQDGHEMEALIYYGSDSDKENLENKEFNFNKLVIASNSDDKRKGISQIAKVHGLEITQSLSIDSEDKEKKYQKILKEIIKKEVDKDEEEKLGYEPKFYVLDIAKMKAENEYNYSKNTSIIASDAVVLEGLNILEKPGDEKNAIEILTDLSGKEVTVSCGIALLTQTKSGRKIMLNEGINFTFKLKDFLPQEAEDYVNQQGGKVLSVAGVIDYSKSEAQGLIDSRVPVKVEALNLEGHKQDTVLISSKILVGLRDYLKGVPNELIEAILNKRKALSEVEF